MPSKVRNSYHQDYCSEVGIVHLLRLSTSSDTEDLLGLLPLPLPRLLKVLAGLPGALPSASSNHPWVGQCQCCSIKVKGCSFFFLPDISEDLTSVCPTYAHSLSVDPVQVKAWDNGRKSRAWLQQKLLVSTLGHQAPDLLRTQFSFSSDRP